MHLRASLASLTLALASCSRPSAPVEAPATVEARSDAASDASPSDEATDASATDVNATDASVDGPPEAATVALEIVPSKSAAIHEHGGAPASLDTARFTVRNRGTTPVSLAVRAIAFLTGSSCDTPPATVQSRPTVVGIEIGGAPSSARVSIPPGAAPLVVRFSPVHAYYTYCNRFAFRVTFDAGGDAITVTAETTVSRIDPMPHH